MSEMEPVEQKVTADLSGYVDPIEEAAAATDQLAASVDDVNSSLAGLRESAAGARDALAETGAAASDAAGQLDALSGTEEAVTGSTETLAEAQRRFRDAVIETYPEIDIETASLLADAAAMEALGLSAEETAATIGRTADYQALLDATFGLAAGESLLVGRNGDMSLSFAAADGAAVDLAGSLNVAAGGGDALAGSLTADAGAADAAASSFTFLGPAIGVAIIAALGPAAALVTTIAAIGSAALLVLPDVREIQKVLTGTGTAAPKTGPVAQAVAEIHQLGAAWRQIGADTGLQGDFLRGIGEVAHTIEDFLIAITPLARAGATSIDEIVSALDRTANSTQFSGFIHVLAADAPAATEAVIRLAGAVGGDLGAVLTALAPQAAGDTGAIAGLADQLKGPLFVAATLAGSGLHGLIESFDSLAHGVGVLLGPLTAIEGPLKGTVSQLGGLGSIATGVARDLGITLAGPLAMGLLIPRSHETAAAARDAGAAAKTMGADMAGAAGQTSALAFSVQNLTATFAKALNPQVSLDQAAITYRDDLATLRTDLASSADAIGLNTGAQRTSYSAYLAVIQAAEAYAGAEHGVGGGADAMRSVLEQAISALDRTGAHGSAAAKLIDELRDALLQIPANVYSTIHINQVGNVPIATGGSGGSGGGGGVHIQPGATGQISAASFIPAPSLTPGGFAQQLAIHVPVTIAPGLGAMTDPRFLQGLQPVIQEAVLRYAYQNQGTGFGLPGRHL